MGQVLFEGSDVRTDVVERGYALIEHDISTDALEELIGAYAVFTTLHPEPEPETLDRMMSDVTDLDQLDYAQDNQSAWHKYRTNHPRHAKPGGYTNRSLQVAVLQVRGRNTLPDGTLLTDDPKEYYHFDPHGLDDIQRQHETYSWGKVPPEVFYLHKLFTPIHHAAQLAIRRTMQQLEDEHPELLSRYITPEALEYSPLRLLFYHHGQGPLLANSHFDKSISTIQIAESHVGLRLQNPQTLEMEVLRRSAEHGVFFMGYSWQKLFPNTPLPRGLHDVIQTNELNDGRELPTNDCSRWALISFTNSKLVPVPEKHETHSDSANPEKKVPGLHLIDL